MLQTTPPGADFSNDLMLLRLSKPADITDAVKPIDLPTEEPKLGSTCLASGWGSITPTKCESSPRNIARCRGGAEGPGLGPVHHPLSLSSTGQIPNDLQCGFIKPLPNENCAKAYIHKVTDVMLCAGEMGGGKDTCAVRQTLSAMRRRAERTEVLGSHFNTLTRQALCILPYGRDVP